MAVAYLFFDVGSFRKARSLARKSSANFVKLQNKDLQTIAGIQFIVFIIIESSFDNS